MSPNQDLSHPLSTMASGQVTSIELFTGAGGLALGVAQAGFSHGLVVEWDHDACDSSRENSSRGSLMAGWNVQE